MAISDFYNTANSIDLLFNNAGCVKRGTSTINILKLSAMINSNLIGAVNLIKESIHLIKIKNYGYIVNLSSRSTETPRGFLGGYCATKAALLAFNESL